MTDKKYKKGFEKLEEEYSCGLIEFPELKKEILKLQPIQKRLQRTILKLSGDVKNKDKILRLCRVRDNLGIAIDTVNDTEK